MDAPARAKARESRLDPLPDLNSPGPSGSHHRATSLIEIGLGAIFEILPATQTLATRRAPTHNNDWGLRADSPEETVKFEIFATVGLILKIRDLRVVKNRNAGDDEEVFECATVALQDIL
jgi:hypothetical protein